MTVLTEITVTERDESGAYQPVRGSKLAPYAIEFNDLTNLTAYYKEQERVAKIQTLVTLGVLPESSLETPKPIAVNLDEQAMERGFHIMQQKIMLAGFWGVEHVAEDDIAKFGEKFPTVHLSLIEVSTPKPNGHLDALKNYARRDYVGGQCVSTWRARPIQWDQFS